MLRISGVVPTALCVLSLSLAPVAARSDGEVSEPEAAAAPETTEEAAPEETPEIPSATAEAAKEDAKEAAADEVSEAVTAEATEAAAEVTLPPEAPEGAAEGEPVAVETVEATVLEPPKAEETEVAEIEAEEGPKKAWSASVAHSFGWGLQADDVTGYSYGTLSASGSYKVMEKVNASASVGMQYTLDKTPNDAVRADLGAVSLGLNHTSLYNDEDYTGLNITGGISFSQSMSMGTLRFGRGPNLGIRLGASRSVGPVGLSYSLGLNKPFSVDAVPVNSVCSNQIGAENCATSYATNWGISNAISANYSPIDELALTASLSFNNMFSFAPTSPDQFTNPANPNPNNRRYSFGFGLSGSWITPIKGLVAGLSFSNMRPWRTDGQTLALVDFSHGVGMIFDSRFAAMSLDVSYSF